MLRVVAFVLVGLAAVWVACSLPVDEKVGCVTSVDCVDDRICEEGRCVAGGCGVVCLEACDRVDQCGFAMVDDECASECIDANGLLPEYGDAECKQQWDELFTDEDECESAECLLLCRDLCVYAKGCLLIVDAPACAIGCQQTEGACPPIVTECSDVPSTVQCWESGAC